MIIADFGTSYTKILELTTPQGEPVIIPTRDVPPDFRADMASGHNGKRFSTNYVNELVAMARAGEELINEGDFILVDCGSRDIKFIRYKDHQLADMGWNAECGASLGFSIELLGRYYSLNFNQLPIAKQTFSVTCGVLGMSHIFDAVISGVSEAEAVASYIKGIAINAYRFVGSPDRLYLAGGLCDNSLFVHSLPCEVILLGRFVLLSGMTSIINKGNYPGG